MACIPTTFGDNTFPTNPPVICNSGGNVIVNGNVNNNVTNSGGFVIINGTVSAGVTITNNGGSLTIKVNSNANVTLDNMGGAIVIGNNANNNMTINNRNCNITIGMQSNNSSIELTDGLFALGHSFQNSTLTLNNSVFILPSSNLTLLSDGLPFLAGTIINMGSGSNALLIDTSITGFGDQDYTMSVTISGFNYNDDTIVLPSFYAPYTAQYVGSTLTITGTINGGVTYLFNMPGATNMPVGPVVLPIIPVLQYSFVTPAAAEAIDTGPDLTTPPTPTIQSYNGDSYFGGNPPVIPPCAVICYSGESIIYSKNKLTGTIGYTKARDIFADTHEVFSEKSNTFVPVKHNIITGQTTRYVLIKKDSLGPNQPCENFYITSGHRVIHNGIEIKANRLPNAKRVKVNPAEMVYTICTELPDVITVNGMPVVSWGYNEWISYADKRNIAWKENLRKIEENIHNP